MSSCRGSSLLELIVATAIFAVLSAAVLSLAPTQSIHRFLEFRERAVSSKIIEDELEIIIRDAEPITNPVRVLPNIVDLIQGFSEVTSPKEGNDALVAAQFYSASRLGERIIDHQRYPFELSIFRSSVRQAAIGCSPTSCLELTCADRNCSLSSNSLLFNQDSKLIPYIVLIIPVREISILYLSKRSTLRKIALINGEVIENQPILDNIAELHTSVSQPSILAEAYLVDANFRIVGKEADSITLQAMQSFAPLQLLPSLLRVQL